MEALAFSLKTANGEERVIEFPLHPETGDAAAVGDMLEALLETLSEYVTGETPVSNGDVVQALAMVTSIRLGMLPVPMKAARALFDDLLEQAAEAEQRWHPGAGGRA
ncbi:MAG: hypothetical protein P8172_04055 [Gammaproteobacteria bacterium]|jgi:hypothetical protein